MTSTGLPRADPPKSSTAIRAARRDPGPEMSTTNPDMSVSTPILTPSAAKTGQATRANRDATADRRLALTFIVPPFHARVLFVFRRQQLARPGDPFQGAAVLRPAIHAALPWIL